MPPGRVRAAWKKLDTDRDGFLTLDECLSGFASELGVEALDPRVVQCIETMFEAHGAEKKDGFLGMASTHVLSITSFSRFYAEVLFTHFDVNGNGTLQLAEVQEALCFLVKPNAQGERVMPSIAFPPEFTKPSGEVELPMSWFWATFTAMD